MSHQQIGLEGGEVDTGTDGAIRSALGRGRPLDTSIRGRMESSFGADFSSVRVHADSNADSLNKRIQAKAFTTGRDIFFSKGQFNPSSHAGQELLAHELTHVVQQGAAGVARRVVRRSTDVAATTMSETASADGGSTLTLRGANGPVGSVRVRPTDRASVEAMNLEVAPQERGRGHGNNLVAAAARVGARTGKSNVELGSQDSGTGRLDNWYQSLGFSRTGQGRDGFTRFQASTSTLERGRVQRSSADR